MMIRRSGRRFLAGMAASGLLLTGCFFNLSEEKDFKSWYYGKPGMAGALGETRCDPYADRIQGERHAYYLHFRTPEVFYQPQGGDRYPERSTATLQTGGDGRAAYACEIVDEGRETFNFNAVDAGLVDVVLPLRQKAASPEDAVQVPETASYASSVAHNAGIAAVMKAPVYLVHDVLKTLYIPVAGAYYLLKSDDRTPVAVAVADDRAITPAAVSATADVVAPPQPTEAKPPGEEMADPAAGSAISDEDAHRGVPADAAATLAVADTQTTTPTDPPLLHSSPAQADASPAGRPVETPEARAAFSGSEAAETKDAPRHAAEAGRASQAPARSIHEEDLPILSETVSSENGALGETEAHHRAAVRDIDASPEAVPAGSETEAEIDTLPRARSRDGAAEVVSVSESRKPLAGPAEPSNRLEEVKISRRDLTKQVAFLGFVSRTATVDPTIKDLFEKMAWPAMVDECGRRVRMLRKGEAPFPQVLTGLTRDQFGRLNSFELTTLARFSGINAVVTGSVIDISLANEIGGILWYKSPKGILRVSILAEVYDAETGTKLLDRTLVREMEVAELEPGSEGRRLRKEDLASVQIALESIAAEMGEMVCDVLEDQPWRGFVTGIDGTRITLSAGADSGLVAGNVLAVHNSQIIEGLNNQQFFLTGERVGLLQITRVHPDYAEARLIEGKGLKDYSLVLPER